MDNATREQNNIESAIRRYLGNAQWWTISDVQYKLRRDGLRLKDSAVIETLKSMADRGYLQFRIAKNANTGVKFLEYALPDRA